MDERTRQFLKTAAWLFMRHGQKGRALGVCAALNEDDPSDPVSACAYAQLLLEGGNPEKALKAISAAGSEAGIEHASAVLETRALAELGRKSEARSRWRRHLESMKGPSRKWM